MQTMPQAQPQQPVRPTAPATTTQPTPAAKPKNESRFGSFLRRKWWLLLIIVVVLVLALVTAYFGYRYFTERNNPQVQGTQTTNQDAQPADALTAEQLVDEVRKLIKLPDETPEVATISNVALLEGQDFFKDAENGDAVIIFKQAGRGLLYRPSTKMIIEYSKVTYEGSLPK